MRMPARLADRCYGRNSLPRSTQIRRLARQIEPGLVALGRDDRLHDRVTPMRDRPHLVVQRIVIALRPEVAWSFAERTVDLALPREERSLDHDLRVRGHHQPLAPRLRRNEPQRLLHVTTDDLVFVDLEAAAVSRAHVEGRVVAEDRRDRALLTALLVCAEDLPEVARRHETTREPRTLDLHP